MLKEVDSTAHRVEHDSLVDVADFFDIVVMPVATAYIALALVRLPVIYGLAVTDKAHNIVVVIKKGL